MKFSRRFCVSPARAADPPPRHQLRNIVFVAAAGFGELQVRGPVDRQDDIRGRGGAGVFDLDAVGGDIAGAAARGPATRHRKLGRSDNSRGPRHAGPRRPRARRQP